jgi:signal peptidase I
VNPTHLDSEPYRPPDPFAEAHDEIEHLRSEADEEAEKVEASRSFWRELPVLVLIALIAAILIKTFLVQAFWIPSGSMEETLQVKDRVLVSKLSYRFGEVERGDVIVFDDPDGRRIDDAESLIGRAVRNVAESIGLSTPKSEFIKRVIGVGGDVIEVREDQVYVNGEAIFEPYRSPRSAMGDYGPSTVPDGFVFVMGDNRDNSVDSRVFGPVPTSDIVGRAFVIAWPPSRWSGL